LTAAVATATRWFSLRRRLLALLLGGVTAGWCATLMFSYFDAHHEIDELFDAQLVQTAQTLLAMASEYDDDEEIAELNGHGHKYQKRLVFQLWDAEGHLLLRSRHAPTVPLAAADGFSEIRAGHGDTWRYYSQWDRQRQLRVQVGENHHVREELAGHIAARLLAPALFGLPLIGVWVWFATRRGLAPIDAVAAQVAHRAPGHLAPLAPATAPDEVRPLLEALNDLLARVEHALEAERRFTADAAHELRTPLAALVAQAQVALRARDAAERDHAIEQIAASGQRASHLVDQLLTLARLDPAAGVPMSAHDLGTLAAEVCADHGAAALAKDIALELDAPEAMAVQGNADLLRILLRNLVDNAVRYTPAGGRIEVRVGREGPSVRLAVADSGPGIPPSQRAQALRRFYRLAEQDIQGSGLGLSIAARIAELHGARLDLADGIGVPGLSVSLLLPTA
jgi:two-component system sensor histidine kinase QseC